MKHECWAIQYMREDGTPAGRADYYSYHQTALRSLSKGIAIHGSYPNGAPRWRLIHMAEVNEVKIGDDQ